MKMKNVADVYPLAPMQELMLLHLMAAPSSAVLCEQNVYRLRGRVDSALFRQAWEEVVARHAALRTAFLSKGLAKPLQVVREKVSLPWRQEDLSGLSSDEHDRLLSEILTAERSLGFRPEKAPLLRLALVRLDETTHHMGLTFHHILLDRWSVGLVLRDVVLTYKALVRGEHPAWPSPRPYRDYIAWLQQQDPAAVESYWSGTLAGLERPTSLADDRHPQQPPGDQDWAEVRTHLGGDTAGALVAMARARHLTLGTLVEGAWSLLLHQRSGDSTIVFGATVAARPAQITGSEEMIGLFTNNLPVRVDVDRSASIADWLKTLQLARAELRQFEHSPLGTVQASSEIGSSSPLFESLLVFQNDPTLDLEELAKEPRLELEAVGGELRTNYTWTLMVSPGDDFELLLVYDGRRFDTASAQSVVDRMATLLTEMAARPDRTVGDLVDNLEPMLGPGAAGEVQAAAVENSSHSKIDLPIGELPSSPIEKAIAEVWAEALELKAIGVHYNFWDLGGSSLMAVQTIAKLEKRGLTINPADMIFQSLGQLAATLEARDTQTPSGPPRRVSAAPPKAPTEKPSRGSGDASLLPATSAGLSIQGLHDIVLEPAFFGPADEPLFGCLHRPPSATSSRRGVILCNAMGHEYSRSHRAYRYLAERLAGSGLPVLRFDYFATGDSAGEDAQASTSRWLDDIAGAVDELRQQTGATEVSLVGRRLGATLAVLYAAEHPGIDRLVLWDPVLRGEQYLEDLRGLHSDYVLESRGQYIGSLLGPEELASQVGDRVEYLGQPMGSRLQREVAALGLESVTTAPAGASLVIDSYADPASDEMVERLSTLGVDVDREHLPDPESWTIDDPLRQVVPNRILSTIVSWLSGDKA